MRLHVLSTFDGEGERRCVLMGLMDRWIDLSILLVGPSRINQNILTLLFSISNLRNKGSSRRGNIAFHYRCSLGQTGTGLARKEHYAHIFPPGKRKYENSHSLHGTRGNNFFFLFFLFFFFSSAAVFTSLFVSWVLKMSRKERYASLNKMCFLLNLESLRSNVKERRRSSCMHACLLSSSLAAKSMNRTYVRTSVLLPGYLPPRYG